MTSVDDTAPAELPDGALGLELERGRDSPMTVRERRSLAALQGAITGTEPSPVKLSRYVLLESLGSGGAGVVYAAYDPELDRKVAIKLLHERSIAALGSSGGRARFVREARALARLSNPNIVEVFDVGEYRVEDLVPGGPAVPDEDGVFVVMELVPGVRLDEWLKQSRSRAELLSVFVAAGRGLAAAHAAGMTHRDFKPSNVIVEPDGRPRVLDFGLAVGAHESEPEGVVGTPAYMSPEQLRGDAVGPASDQFAFCVALYGALYKARPFAGESFETLRAAVVRGQLAPTPVRRIPLWLRTALIRGLAADPQARWPSMAELIDHLERTPRARRRRLWIAGIGAATAFAAFLQATADPTKCSDARDALVGVWDQTAAHSVRLAFDDTGVPYAASSFDRTSELLNAFTDDWVQARRAACESAGRTPRTLDLRMACLDRRRSELAALVDVLMRADGTVVEHAVTAAGRLSLDRCTDAIALRAEHARSDPNLAPIREALAQASALASAGKAESARAIASAAVEQAKPLDPDLWIEALLIHGRALHQTAKFHDAKALLQDAYAAAVERDRPALAVDAALELGRLVGIDLARHEDGRRWLEKARPIADRLGAPDLALGRLETRDAAILRVTGQLERAHQAQLRALDMLADADPAAFAQAMQGLGNLSFDAGEHDRAEREFQRALELREAHYGSDHPVIGSTLNAIAVTQSVQARYQDAASTLERSLGILETARGPHHPELIQPLGNLGIVLKKLGRVADAIAVYRRALAIHGRNFGLLHPGARRTRINISIALIHQGDTSAARDQLGLARESVADGLGREHADYAHVLHTLASAALAEDSYAEARALEQEALSIIEPALGSSHAKVAMALVGIGRAELALDRPGAALAVLERAVAIRRRSEGRLEEHAGAIFALARAVWAAEHDRDRAVALAREAASLYRRAGPGAQTRIPRIERFIEAPS